MLFNFFFVLVYFAGHYLSVLLEGMITLQDL